jgi:hypothetical protein
MGVNLSAIFGGKGKAIEHLVAMLVKPEPVAQRVDRLAAGAEVGKVELSRPTIEALAFNKLGDKHATTFLVAITADPLDVHASWIPENSRRRSE